MVTYKQAIAQALAESMREHPRSFVLGQDVERFSILGVTAGLAEELEKGRVRDCPIAESAMVGIAVGAAMNGYVGILEFAYADISAVAFSSIVHSAAKIPFASNDQLRCPMLIRSPIGRWSRHGPMGTEVTASWYQNVPGITVAMPATVAEAYWQVKAAFSSNYPTMFLEDKALYPIRGEIGDRLDVTRPRVQMVGSALTLVAAGRCVDVAQKAVELLGAGGQGKVEIISLGHVKPLDFVPIHESLQKTGRLLVVQDEPRNGGYGPIVISEAAQCGVPMAQPVLIARKDEHLPYLLEEDHLVSAATLVEVLARYV